MPQPVMELKIAPVRSALRDLRSNMRWIIAIAAVWVLYTLASSAVIRIWEDWGYWQSCYFTLINMTTVGFGDITPLTQEGKVLAGVNSVVGLMLFGLFVASITMALQPSSFDGTAELKDVAVPGNKNVEDEGSNEEKVGRFLEAVNGLVSLGEEVGEVRHRDHPKIVDILVDVEGDIGRSKYIHLHVRVRKG
ncbi:potassium channel family protein [Marinimicrobium sp. ARAG 43.8]|uniref:potassium channel family protein n=1 Tax=Marinimicrobium sp. ARAG 43.8 TaxID=3418719 RepID=UPI003CFB33C9